MHVFGSESLICAGIALSLTFELNYYLQDQEPGDMQKAKYEFTEKENPILKKALHALETFVAEYPHHGMADPYMALANARHLSGNLEGSIQSLRDAQRVNPHYKSMAQSGIDGAKELQLRMQEDGAKGEL
jgi:hypothetical protein